MPKKETIKIIKKISRDTIKIPKSKIKDSKKIYDRKKQKKDE